MIRTRPEIHRHHYSGTVELFAIEFWQRAACAAWADCSCGNRSSPLRARSKTENCRRAINAMTVAPCPCSARGPRHRVDTRRVRCSGEGSLGRTPRVSKVLAANGSGIPALCAKPVPRTVTLAGLGRIGKGRRDRQMPWPIGQLTFAGIQIDFRGQPIFAAEGRPRRPDGSRIHDLRRASAWFVELYGGQVES